MHQITVIGRDGQGRKTDVTDLGVEAGISKSKQECTEHGNVDAGCVNGYESVHMNPQDLVIQMHASAYRILFHQLLAMVTANEKVFPI